MIIFILLTNDLKLLSTVVKHMYIFTAHIWVWIWQLLNPHLTPQGHPASFSYFLYGAARLHLPI